LSGGGRHDYRVSRIVDVFILTMSLQDPGGRDENAVRGHLLREEEVYDALHDQPPPGTPQNNSIPVTFKWVPGGAEIARQVRVDPGMLVSVLSFQIKYRGFMTVFRST
jgi:hypothetical protein